MLYESRLGASVRLARALLPSPTTHGRTRVSVARDALTQLVRLADEAREVVDELERIAAEHGRDTKPENALSQTASPDENMERE
jgi:hypothetical protein